MIIHHAIKNYVKRFFKRVGHLFDWNRKKFIQRYQKQSCDRCGDFQWIEYHIKNTTWIYVTAGWWKNVLCLNCFLELAANKNTQLETEDFTLLILMNDDSGISIINNSEGNK